MNWKDYEKEIFEHFKNEYQNAQISYDKKIVGIYSKIDRQVDILIEDYVAGNKISIIVDGKYFNKKIDVKIVESFLGMLKDINAHKGILITQKGFTKSATNRAYYDPTDIELDILNFKDIKKWQGFVALPYSGKNAVFIYAPFGWVIDIKTEMPTHCYMYQRGIDIEQAKRNIEFMYINFWYKTSNISSIDQLIEEQNKNILHFHPDAKIKISNTIKRKDANTKLREADIPAYNGLEITGYVEFGDFIFFCVLLTPYELQNKNRRKLEYLLAKIIPTKIEFDNSRIIKQSLRELKKLKDKEDRAKIRMKISQWYEEMHDVNNAIKVLEELVLEFPTHYSGSKKLLELKFQTKKKELVKKELIRFYNLDPKNPTIYDDLLEIFETKYPLLVEFFKNGIRKSKDEHILGNLYLYLAQITKDKKAQEKYLSKAREYLETVLGENHNIFQNIDERSNFIK